MSNQHIEASKRFNPKNLCKHLIKSRDGVVIVDRDAVLNNADDERMFIITLSDDYGWNYRNFENSTVYFELDKHHVIGGVYDIESNSKITRRQIIPLSEVDGLTHRYVYKKESVDEIITAIETV